MSARPTECVTAYSDFLMRSYRIILRSQLCQSSPAAYDAYIAQLPFDVEGIIRYCGYKYGIELDSSPVQEISKLIKDTVTAQVPRPKGIAKLQEEPEAICMEMLEAIRHLAREFEAQGTPEMTQALVGRASNGMSLEDIIFSQCLLISQIAESPTEAKNLSNTPAES